MKLLPRSHLDGFVAPIPSFPEVANLLVAWVRGAIAFFETLVKFHCAARGNCQSFVAEPHLAHGTQINFFGP